MSPIDKIKEKIDIEKLKQPKTLAVLGSGAFVLIFIFMFMFSGGDSDSKPSKEVIRAKKKPIEETLPDKPIETEYIAIPDVNITPQIDLSVKEPELPKLKEPEFDFEREKKKKSAYEIQKEKERLEKEKEFENKLKSLESVISKLEGTIDKQDDRIKKLKEEKKKIAKNAIKAPVAPKEPAKKTEIVEPPKPKKIRRVPAKDDEIPPLFQLSGTGGSEEAKKQAEDSSVSNFIMVGSDFNIPISESEVDVQQLPNLANMIAQGRVIDGTLETAINSEIPGNIRGIVSKNVYGEKGRRVLIPRGSRLYGTYSTASRLGQTRIAINWTRVIRPDGIEVGISSQASDQFGRQGVTGDVNNKYFETLQHALLLSLVTVSTGIAVDAISDDNTSTTTTDPTTGTSTTTSDAKTAAAKEVINTISTATNDILNRAINVTPIITVNQGTKIKILVNQDLQLPTYKSITKIGTSVTTFGNNKIDTK